MSKFVVGIVAGLALGAGGTWFAVSHTGTAAPGAAAAPAAAPEKPKENPLHLKPAKRAAAGIVLAKPTSATLSAEVNAFGRVLDATPFVALVGEIETARTALVASEKAAARAKELFSAGANASAQTVETAEATAARDRVALASARARLIAGWGRKLAEADLNSVSASLETGTSLVRLDLLPGDVPAAELKTATVGLLSGGETVAAEILGPAPVVDPQLQGTSFLAVVRGHPLPAGSTLRATLAGPGAPVTALVIPRSAVVYHQGSAWIFVLGEEDTFERRLVTLGRSIGDKVAITGGAEASEQVVTAGAAQLLSAELQAGGAAGEG